MPRLESSIEENIDRILNMSSEVPLVFGATGRGMRALKEQGRSAADALNEYANILERRQSNVLEDSPPDY